MILQVVSGRPGLRGLGRGLLPRPKESTSGDPNYESYFKGHQKGEREREIYRYIYIYAFIYVKLEELYNNGFGLKVTMRVATRVINWGVMILYMDHKGIPSKGPGPIEPVLPGASSGWI